MFHPVLDQKKIRMFKKETMTALRSLLFWVNRLFNKIQLRSHHYDNNCLSPRGAQGLGGRSGVCQTRVSSSSRTQIDFRQRFMLRGVRAVFCREPSTAEDRVGHS